MFSVVINTKRWKLEFLFQEKFKDVPCSSLDSDAAAENTKINIYVLQVTFTEQTSEHETRQGFKDHHSPADSTAIHLWSIRMIKKQSCVFKNGGTRWKIMNTSYQQPVKLKCFLTGKKRFTAQNSDLLFHPIRIWFKYFDWIWSEVSSCWTGSPLLTPCGLSRQQHFKYPQLASSSCVHI